MTENNTQQIKDLLGKSKSIAILLTAEVGLDEYCSALALQAALKTPDRTISIFSSASVLPAVPFLETTPEVRSRFSQSDQFGIKVSTAHAKAGEIRYELETDGVVIYLKTTTGEFMPEDVSVLPVRQKFDLFVSLGVSNLEQLGPLYTDNAAIFFDIPHLNIDINPSNEYFGTLNHIVVTASSVAELVSEFLDDDQLSRQEVSTALLAGIISRTHSFRDPRTTPKALSVAAKLVTSGAKRQDIIQHLFKTKPFPVLQLWGRALARLATVPAHSLIHTTVTKSDIEKTHAAPDMLPEVLRDMVEIVSGFSLVGLIAEMLDEHQVLLAGLPHANVQLVAGRMGAEASTPQPLVGQFEFVKLSFKDKTTTALQDELLAAVKAK